MKKMIYFLLSLAAAITFSACGGNKVTYPELSGQEAIDAFASSKSISLTGDLDDVNTFSDVIADEKIAGYIKEGGLLNPKITYQVDGKDQFYIKYLTDGSVDDERYACSTTYAYYDMDDNVLGYAQERALFKGDNEWYVMTFLDADKQMKNYYVEAKGASTQNWAVDGAAICNMDRKAVGEVKLDLTNIITDSFTVDMEMGDAAEELSEMDRVAIYWHCVSEINDRYDD